jgi:hypothetical protein
MAKKLVYTTNTPSATTDYAAADGTWKTIGGGGGGSGTVTSVATTAPITGGPITTSGTIGITQASGSTDGYLSSTDWNTFNNKQSSITLTTTGTTGAATLVGSTLNIPLYSSGATSFLCANHLANTIAASTTSYNGFISGAFVTAANEYTRNFLIPVASTAGNYSIQTITTQPATGALIFTIRKNSVDTAITITVPAGSAGAISTTATTVAFSALDRISIKVQNLATTASAQITHQSITMTI